jgi:hypothetical protein
MYRHVDAALIRAAAYPSALVLPERPLVSGDEGADTGSWRSWTGQVWQLQPLASIPVTLQPVRGSVRSAADAFLGSLGNRTPSETTGSV